MLTIKERLASLKAKTEKELEVMKVNPGFTITDNGELLLNKEAFAILDTHHVLSQAQVLRGEKEVTSTVYCKDRLALGEDDAGNLLLIISSDNEVNGHKTVKLGKTTRKAKPTVAAPIVDTLISFYNEVEITFGKNQFFLEEIISNAEHTIAIVKLNNPVFKSLDNGIIAESTIQPDSDIEKVTEELIEEISIPQEIERIANELNIEEPVNMVTHHGMPTIPLFEV